MAHDFSLIARFGLDSLLGDLMPMVDGQFVRLADVEAVLQATDPVVEANRQLLLDRSRVGMVKYGVPLEGTSLSHAELTQHALEEALDLANYLQATLRKLRGEQPATQTEDLAGAVWDGPNTASQVDPCMGLPSKPNHQLEN